MTTAAPATQPPSLGRHLGWLKNRRHWAWQNAEGAKNAMLCHLDRAREAREALDWDEYRHSAGMAEIRGREAIALQLFEIRLSREIARLEGGVDGGVAGG